MQPEPRRRNSGLRARAFLLWLSIVAVGSLFLRWLLGLAEEGRQREQREMQREAALRARDRPVRYPPPHIHHADQGVRVRLPERVPVLVLFLGGALVLAAVIVVAVWGSLSWSMDAPFLRSPGRQGAQEESGAELPLPSPGAQAQRRATQEAALNQYQWVDREAGIAQIPLDRAIELVIERGVAPQATAVATPPVTETMTATLTSTAQPEEAMIGAGAALFQTMGCADCHRADRNGLAPNLEGVFGSEVLLQSGETVTADEAYIRRSILEPDAQVVAGFQPVMPPFEGRLSEQELAQLVAYIRSIRQE